MVLAAVAGLGVGWTSSLWVRSPGQVAAETAPPPPSVITVPVEREVLRSEVVVRGSVVAAQTMTVAGAALGGDDGPPVVTAVQVGAGEEVAAGQVVMEISGRPLFVLSGAVPVYRDLRPGQDGKDIAQFQEALEALGFSSGSDEAGYFGSGTKSAVRDFYESIGYEPLPASPDDDTLVQAADDAVTQAERALTAAENAVDAAHDSDPPLPAAEIEPLDLAVDYAEEDLDRARESRDDVLAAAGPTVPSGELVFVSRLPARLESTSATVGGAVPEEAVTFATGDLQVVAALDGQNRGLVHEQLPVEIFSEVLGEGFTGTVSAVTTTPPAGSSSAEGGAEAGTEYAVITADEPIPATFAGQDVRVSVIAGASDGEVLVVPVTAISAGVDGRTYVTVLEAGGAQSRVDVVTGILTTGFVEITSEEPDAIAPGDEAVVGVQPVESP